MKQRVNLADVDNSLDSLTTSYSGEAAGEYVAAALLSGKTLSDGAITIKPNVKYKEVVKKVSSGDIIADATCDFDLTADALTLTERILTPKEMQVNLQLCKKDFRNDYEAISMGFGVYDQMPPSFSDFLIAHVAGKVAEKTEQNIWGGVDGAGQFDGFTVLMAADGDVNDAANDSVTAATGYTSGNIISLLGNVVDSVPSAVYGAEDMTIYVPTTAWKAYVRSLGGFSANGVGAAGVGDQGSQWYNQGNALSFEGIRLQHCPGMPSDHIVAGEASNLFFGTGLLSDSQECRIIDTSETLGDQNVRVVLRFTSGIQYGIGSDLVLQTLVP